MALLPVAEALARIVDGLTPLDAESVAIDVADGRVLASPLAAQLTQPPFNASAMDGYAVRATDAGHVPATLTVVGESAAGHPFDGDIGPGEAARIFTGAPLPGSADAVVMQEDTVLDGDTLTVRAAATPGQHVRPKGIDFAQDDELLPAGLRLGPRQVSLAAAMNHAHVPVRRRPVVAILATGDELVAPGTGLAPGQIVSSTPVALAGLVRRFGGEPLLLGIAADTLASLDAAIARGAHADILLTIGGASVGDHDLVQEALRCRGLELAFWKVAMRPGKPLMFGRLGAQRVLGVPGNPVSAILCARIFLVPMIERLSGLAGHETGLHRARLTTDLPANGPRQHYMRASMVRDDDGALHVTPAPSQDSSLLVPLARAQCLIVRAVDAPEARAGDSADVLLLDF